ncbi:hypothetical protein D3C73_1534240 [compost metagenome]
MATSAAFSSVSTKGSRIGLNSTSSNWDSTDWLKVSAVMPVLSETMYTVRAIGVDVMCKKFQPVR